jgi:hypothetical protein
LIAACLEIFWLIWRHASLNNNYKYQWQIYATSIELCDQIRLDFI